MKTMYFLLTTFLLLGMTTFGNPTVVETSHNRTPESRGAVVLGYCTDEINKGVGAGYFYAMVGAAITFPATTMAEHVGKGITEISIGIFQLPLSDVEVWITENSVNGKRIVQHSVVNPVWGWQTIVLSNPYEITGEQIYIGYECTSDVYPLGWCETGELNKNANLYFELGMGGFYNRSEKGAWNIRATVRSLDVPSAITAYTVTPGANGELSADISFRTPTTNVSGTVITITKAEIFREEESIKIFTNPATNTTFTYRDVPTEANKHISYTVVCYNDDGGGISSTKTVFIGEDKAGMPTNVTVANNNNSVTINWTAPSAGLNGGWFDANTISYNVIRLPDNAIVAQNVSNTTFVDNTIVGLNNYAYTIESKTKIGVGGVSKPSNYIAVGNSIILPYIGLTTVNDFALWKVTDVNADNKKWIWDAVKKAAVCKYNSKAASNDFMVSSPIKMISGKSYVIKYSMKVNYRSKPAKMLVTIGKGTSVEAQSVMPPLADYPNIIDEAGDERSVVYVAGETADFNIGFKAYSDANMSDLFVSNFMVTELLPNDLMALSIESEGTVLPVGIEKSYTVRVKNNGGNSQSSYSVAIVGINNNQLAIKDFNVPINRGEIVDCVVPYINTTEGELEIFGKVILNTDQNEENDRTPFGLTVLFKRDFQVIGKVVDPLGTAMGGVRIKVTGSADYDATTNGDGTFILPSVVVGSDYQIYISQPNFAIYESTFNVESGDVDLGTIHLADKTLVPINATAVDNNESAEVVWEEGYHGEFRYDDGVVAGRVSTNFFLRGATGTVYRTPTELKSMSWWTVGKSGDVSSVKLFVFGLDADGMPTRTLLFSKLNHPNVHDRWNTFTFPEPIDCPNGFMIAVNGTFLGCDSGMSNEWPFVPNRTFSSANYELYEFRPLEEVCNLMLRADGVRYETGETKESNEEQYTKAQTNQPESFIGYRVYRFLQENEGDYEAWTKLTDEPIEELSYVDDDWNALPQGIYKYAVESCYLNDVKSPFCVTFNTLPKSMLTSIDINVNTNTPSNESTGATIVITNEDGDNSHVYTGTVDNGKASISGVWKGTYKMCITLAGFKPYEVGGLDWGTDNQYTPDTFVLIEDRITPYNLEVVETGIAIERMFNWNVDKTIKDDFESHDNFKINSSGTVGWSYIDADNKSTVGFTFVYFQNGGSKMAYIVFNPSQTDPPFEGAGSSPHSGEKYLASFSAVGGVTDDYFISPELSFSTDFVLSFWAKSWTNTYGLERMKVGYSTTGNQKVDFTNWLTAGDYVEVPDGDEWTRYSFVVPVDAKYVTIACMSNAAFLLMIDDVSISNTPAELSKAFDKYEVYLDGNKIGETTDATTYMLNNLTQGDHVAGVKAVYSSGETDITSIPFNVTGTKNKYRVYYNAPEHGMLRVMNDLLNVESGMLVEEGTPLTIITTPDTGYEMKTLTANEVNVVDNQVTVGTIPITIFAEFALKNHLVTVRTPDNGVVTVKNGNTPMNSGDKVEYGTQLTITAIPESSDYMLDHITINGEEISGNKHKVIDDVIVSAVFKSRDAVGDVSATALMVYPNPMNDVLHIDGEYTLLEIYDMTGKIIISEKEKSKIDVNHLMAGTYIVKVYSNDKINVYKIVK